MNAIVRFCYWCQSISDRLSERRKRISQFRSEYERLAIPGPQLSQEDIDAAAAQGVKALWHRLTLEKEKAMSICLQAEEKVGPVPKYEHWLGIDRIVKNMISGLDIKGFRWAGQKFKYPRIETHEPIPDPEYRELTTGRVYSHAEYESIGGPGRCTEFDRVR